MNSVEVEKVTDAISHELLDKLKDIFKVYGELQDYQASLSIDKTVSPVYQKMYRQPYHIRKAINEELERLETLGIIEKTEGPLDLVSNVVATPKSRKVRLCLDVCKINKAIKIERFPIPTLESLLDGMSRSKIFLKIDLKEAYQQLQLYANSRSITNFHTKKGVYRFKETIKPLQLFIFSTTTLSRLFYLF